MRLKITLYTFILFFTALVNLYAKETIINGKIEGKLPEEIRYTAPVNGSMGFDIYYTAKPDAKGNFTIKLDLTEIAVIDLYFDLKPTGAVIATPGDSYSIVINTDDKDASFTVLGKSSAYQKLYNSQNNNYKLALIHDLSSKLWDKSAVDVKQQLKEQEAADIAGFDKLLQQNAIPKDIYNYIKTDRSYFYACAGGYTGFAKHSKAMREPVADISSVTQQWCDIYTALPVNGTGINKTPWGYFYLNGYVTYKWLEQGGFDMKKSESVDMEAVVKKNIPYKYLEFYMASQLNNYIIEGYKDESMITKFNKFKQMYPNSSYIPMLEPGMAPLIKLHTTSTSLAGNAAFVEGYTTVNSLDELIKKFPGKKLYFDVWATWCGPCRQEFAHKDNLYKLLKEHDISVIYISIDRDEKDADWKKMINFYGLDGLHIRTNKSLTTDLHNLFDDKGSIAIPWYMLVGKDGKIVKKHAAPPSDLEKLKKDISAM